MMLARADMLNIGRTMHGGCAVYIIDVCVYCSLVFQICSASLRSQVRSRARSSLVLQQSFPAISTFIVPFTKR